MKTQESRFQVHDELTAPERSMPVLKGAVAGGGQLPNFVGVLAGSPASLRAYARFRSELRHGALPLKTQQRIALAVAEHQGSAYALATLLRTAREAGLALDEIARARSFESGEEHEAAMLHFVRGLLESDAVPPALLTHTDSRPRMAASRATARHACGSRTSRPADQAGGASARRGPRTRRRDR